VSRIVRGVLGKVDDDALGLLRDALAKQGEGGFDRRRLAQLAKARACW
jgi:hypothetical protein